NLWVGAKIEEEGSITIPAKVINEFISSLPPEKVDLLIKETTLSIKSGSFKATVVGTLASEFPQIPSFSGKPILIFDKEDLVASLSQVVFAAAQDEGRPVLTSVFLKSEKEGNISLVATDGYRLSIKTLQVKENKIEENLLIPAKTFLEISRLAQEKSETKDVQLGLTPEKSQVIFNLSDIEFSSRLLEGEFPDFEKIIPQSSTTTAEFDKEEFARSVKIASIFAREQSNIIKLKIEASDGGKLNVSAETPQVGNNESEMTARVQGEPLEIAFNYRFLLDFLSNVKGEEIIFEAAGALTAGVFKVKGDSSYLHLIMPVRIQE
ncbi:MAG: DNA polymerase III subunit beta, partial [bacterium]|nr:DNA polymerase III subunit beta [bacterium]